MRMSELFSQTRRKTDNQEAESGSDLLVRAGFIRQLAAGIYTFMPLALRSLKKIEAIVRSEIDAIGGQEILMPVVNPADIWKESGRWQRIDAEMGRFTDRSERDMVLAMTHEEVVADIVRNEVHSYRHLPRLIYHIQTKWRDDPRPRAGLIRVREFVMKDSYSLDRDADGMKTQYDRHYEAYFKIFGRCGLPTIAVVSDIGMMGGLSAHEFIYPAEIGEDTIIRCPQCGYSANRQIAASDKLAAINSKTEPAAKSPGADEKSGNGRAEPSNTPQNVLKKVHTPGAATIQSLSAFLDLPPTKLAKAVFVVADDTFVAALIRGDLEVNETKLANVLEASRLRPATDEEIRRHGIEPGFGSPIGCRDTKIVVDDTVPVIQNMVTGANEVDHHYINANYGRDFNADIVADIALAAEGERCPHCGSALESFRGVEVGNIFQLGTRYSETMNCRYLDAGGSSNPVYMGSYGIGIGRLLACIAQHHSDEHGLAWPVAVAPFEVHIVDLCKDAKHALKAYKSLNSAGIDVIIDERKERAGVKFNDADLIGTPIRITIGEKSLSTRSAEMRIRRSGRTENVPLQQVKQRIRDALKALRDEETIV